MAHTNSEDLLMEEDIAAAFMDDEEPAPIVPADPGEIAVAETQVAEVEPVEEDWIDPDDFPGQLAVDVYETADKLVIKARAAGISQSDLDVCISGNTLTIFGVLSGGEDEQTTRWHIQECYWGEFSRTISLPVPVREDENSVKAELKDGVLTITFMKEEIEAPKKIAIQ